MAGGLEQHPAAFALSPLVLCMTGRDDGCIRDVNEAFVEVTGYLAALARARPATRDVRLAAVTGYGRREDQERSRSAFDVHLTKPVDERALRALLDGA